MADAKFSIKEALNYGWETFKNHAGFLIGLIVVMMLITFIPDYILTKTFDQGSIGLALGRIVVRLVGLFLGMVATRIALDIHDKDQAMVPALGDLLALYPKYLGGKILYGLMVIIGTLLLIVPGMILAYMFLYVSYVTIDKGLGPINALKQSKTITDGSKWQLFLFSIVMLFVNLVGFALLGIGLLATLPTTLMASAYVYRRLNAIPPPTVL